MGLLQHTRVLSYVLKSPTLYCNFRESKGREETTFDQPNKPLSNAGTYGWLLPHKQNPGNCCRGDGTVGETSCKGGCSCRQSYLCGAWGVDGLDAKEGSMKQPKSQTKNRHCRVKRVNAPCIWCPLHYHHHPSRQLSTLAWIQWIQLVLFSCVNFSRWNIASPWSGQTSFSMVIREPRTESSKMFSRKCSTFYFEWLEKFWVMRKVMEDLTTKGYTISHPQMVNQWHVV